MSSSETNTSKKRWPLWARIIRAVVIIAVVLILALFFAAPPIARSVLEKQLSAQLSTKAVHREAHVEKVRINPLNLSVAIEGLSITEPARNETPVAWRKLYVSLDLRTLVTHEWRFRKIALDGFAGRIAIEKNGKLNIGDLFDNADNSTPAADTPTDAAASTVNRKLETVNSGGEATAASLRINTLTVTDSHLDYSDATLPQPFSTSIGPMSFTVQNFQTGGPDRAPGTFAATTETGETLSWKGNLSIAPLFSRGQLRLGGLSLKKYAPYYTRFVGFDVLDGALDITVNYELSTTARTLTLKARQGGLTLRSLKLAPRGATQPMVAINTIALEQLSVESINDDDPAKSRQTIHIARASLDGGSLALKRDANGFALATLFTPPPETSAPSDASDSRETPTPPTPPAPPTPPTQPAPPTPPSPPIDVMLDELAVQNLAIAFEDTTLGKQPLHKNLTLTTVSAKNFSLNHLDQPLAVAAALQTENGGTLAATGTMTLSPFAGSYTANWTGLRLDDGSLYIEQLFPVRVTQGVFSGAATVSITPAGAIAAKADAAISDFAAVDAATSTPLQSWKQLTVSGVTFASSATTQINIDEVALQSPQTQVIIQPDGALNWLALAGPSGTTATITTTDTTATVADTPATATTATATNPFLVEIKTVTLADGLVAFHDQSIQPAVTMTLAAITGTIASLSTADLAHAKLALTAKVNDTAPISLAGRLNSLAGERTTSLKFSLRDASLAPLEPYIMKYAGRKLASGALTVEVTTKLNARFLDSDNVVTLDNFYFGDKVDSPDATSLPVGLAATLLRDTKGQILLDVPVKGSLDDPNFKYGRAVWRALGNILVKTATAPFNLLASVVSGGGAKPTTASATAAGADAETTTTTTAAEAGATAAPEPDYSLVAFDAGASALNAAAQQKLAIIAQGLLARPGLQLDLAGSYDPTADKPALQKQTLQKLLAGATATANANATANTTANATAQTPAEETLALTRLYQTRFPAPPAATATTNTTTAATPATTTATTAAPAATPPPPPPPALPSPDEMRAKLLATISVTDDQLRQLATSRAQAVKDYLTAQGKVPPAQVSAAQDAAATGARVTLHPR